MELKFLINSETVRDMSLNGIAGIKLVENFSAEVNQVEPSSLNDHLSSFCVCFFFPTGPWLPCNNESCTNGSIPTFVAGKKHGLN